jgi:hypothetical protein
MKNPVVLSIAAAFAMVLFECSGPTTSDLPAGEATAPAITGKLLGPDGKTPAKGAVVTVRPARSIAAISGALGKAKREVLRAVTDERGVYAIAAIDTGTYCAEGADDRGNGARIDGFAVTCPSAAVVLPDDTLKTCGAIRGRIRLAAGGDLQAVFVLAFGCDRCAQVRADGSFLLRNMPEGVYDLKVACVNVGYGEYDSTAVAVASGDTTDIGLVTMNVLDAYIPTNVSVAFDTLKLKATIRWDTCAGMKVIGYQLYRVDRDSSPNQYDKTPYCSDTSLRHGVFVDSILNQGHTYVYCVAAVTGNPGDEQLGPPSAPVTFVASGGYLPFDTLAPPDSLRLRYPLDVAANVRGEIAAAFKHFSGVTIVWYTKDLQQRAVCNIDSPVTTVMPEAGALFCVDDSDNSWFCSSAEGRVVSFDKTGRQRVSVTDSGSVCAFDVVHDTVYLARSGSAHYPDYAVHAYDASGKGLFNFFVKTDTIGGFYMGNDGCGSIIAGSRYIWMITRGGAVQRKIDPGSGVTRILGASQNRILVFHGSGELRIVNSNGELMTRHSIKNTEVRRAAFVGSDKIAVVLLEGILVLKKQGKE